MLQRLAAGRFATRTPPITPDPREPTPVSYRIVPGLGNSGPGHWQSRWENSLVGCARIDLGDWDSPSRHRWVGAIERAVEEAVAPVVLIGHSLGCLAIAWWAAGAAASLTARVTAALLVAPPDIGQQGADLRLMRFGPAPAAPLPFAALVVASADDRYCSLARAEALAAAWRAGCVDIGERGHINADSGLDDWHLGQALLADLVRRAQGEESRRG